jgi:hypothetical protein
MAEWKEQLPKPQEQDEHRRCPTCTAFARLTHRFLDPRQGKIVRLYKCQCGERIWDD